MGPLDIRYTYSISNLSSLGAGDSTRSTDRQGTLMTPYSAATFLHILGALGLFAALALEWAGIYNLRRAHTAGSAREWAGLLGAVRFVGGPSVLIVLVSGIYLAMKF